MRFSQFFETGPTRIPIDSSYYLGSIVALLFSQTLLAAVKPKYMSTSLKRVIATPFILADIIFPMMYRDASESTKSVLSPDHNDLVRPFLSWRFSATWICFGLLLLCKVKMHTLQWKVCESSFGLVYEHFLAK